MITAIISPVNNTQFVLDKNRDIAALAGQKCPQPASKSVDQVPVLLVYRVILVPRIVVVHRIFLTLFPSTSSESERKPYLKEQENGRGWGSPNWHPLEGNKVNGKLKNKPLLDGHPQRRHWQTVR